MTQPQSRQFLEPNAGNFSGGMILHEEMEKNEEEQTRLQNPQ